MKLTRENLRAVYVDDVADRLSLEFGWLDEGGNKKWLDVDFVADESVARAQGETTILAPEVISQMSSVIDSAIEAANAADNVKEVTGG